MAETVDIPPARCAALVGAHAVAWQAVTAPEMVAMPPGPDRDAVEADTTARPAAPHSARSPSQRLDLLADLAARP